MAEKRKRTRSGEAFETAHHSQHTSQDLLLALKQYRAIVVTHPMSQEARFARMAIRSIVSSVIPNTELLDILIEAASCRLMCFNAAGETPVLLIS